VLPSFYFRFFGFELFVSMSSAFCLLALFPRWVSAADRRHAFFHMSIRVQHTEQHQQTIARSSQLQADMLHWLFTRKTAESHTHSSLPPAHYHQLNSAGTAAALLLPALCNELPTITGLLARHDQRLLVRSSRFNTGRGGSKWVGSMKGKEEEALQRKGRHGAAQGAQMGMRSDDTHR
jgi:hypothetical protein